ncbi:oligosaccharide flippase family protein [bacterium]|nr:oligosaccharide flippase family protein [bacterium]
MEFVENREVEARELKAIFRDMLKYSPSKICGMLGNAIVIPIYTALLSPEQYGLYSLSIAVLSFLCIIFSDWVGLSGLRFFKQHEMTQDMPKYLTTLVTILFSNITVMFVLSYIFRGWFYTQFNIPLKYLCAILVLIIPVAVRALLFQLLRAQLKSLSFTLSTIANQIMTIFLSIFFIKVFNYGAAAMLLGMAISISLTDLILIYQSNILSWFKVQKIEWKSVIPIVMYGIPIAASSLSAWIINQSNKVIMNSIHGFSQVGLVGVAYGLTFPIFMTIFAIITVAAIPRIINMYEEKIDVRPLVSKFLGYFVLVALPILTIVSVYSKEFVEIFSSNPKFYEAYIIIPYLAFGVFFMAITDYTTLQYKLAKKTYIDFTIKLRSGIIGVILNIILIPEMGLIGVGIATLAANFLYFILSIIIVLPKLNLIFPKLTLIRMICAFIPTLLIYYFYTCCSGMLAVFEMLSLTFVFYSIYYILSKTLLKRKSTYF